MKNIIIVIMSIAPLSLIYAQKTMCAKNMILHETSSAIQNRLEQSKIPKYIECYLYDRNGENFDKIIYVCLYNNFFVKKCISLSGNTSNELIIVVDTIFQNKKIKNINNFIDNFDDIPKGKGSGLTHELVFEFMGSIIGVVQSENLFPVMI